MEAVDGEREPQSHPHLGPVGRVVARRRTIQAEAEVPQPSHIAGSAGRAAVGRMPNVPPDLNDEGPMPGWLRRRLAGESILGVLAAADCPPTEAGSQPMEQF